jgi:hypothetical protein
MLREDIDMWRSLAALKGGDGPLSTYASTTLAVLDRRGPSFTQELERASGLLPSHFEMGRRSSSATAASRAILSAAPPPHHPPSKRRGV